MAVFLFPLVGQFTCLFHLSRGTIGDALERSVDMSKHVYMVIFFLLMVGSIVGLDVLFLREHFVARLIVNIGIVVVSTGIYFKFLKDL